MCSGLTVGSGLAVDTFPWSHAHLLGPESRNSSASHGLGEGQRDRDRDRGIGLSRDGRRGVLTEGMRGEERGHQIPSDL